MSQYTLPQERMKPVGVGRRQRFKGSRETRHKDNGAYRQTAIGKFLSRKILKENFFRYVYSEGMTVFPTQQTPTLPVWVSPGPVKNRHTFGHY